MAKPTRLDVPADVLELGGGRRLRLGRTLGKGSSATVYKSTLDAPHGVRRLVAVKVFGALASDDIDVVVPLLARAVARAACVRHPNVVEVHEFGLRHVEPFMVQELVDGVTLCELLDRYVERRTRLPLDLSLFIATEVAEGLSGARTARDVDGMQLGLLHLGLTTRDVLLSWRGEVKVTDFELSIARGATSSVRNLRGFSSRARMMAPEVAQGLAGDARSDVFSLGVLARELLVGPRFAPGLSNAQILALARSGHVEPLSFQPHLPDALVGVLRRALALEPGARYPNASAFAADLRSVSMSMGVGDGRWFLRKALDREWGNDAAEVTQERVHPAHGDGSVGHGGEVLSFPKRRRRDAPAPSPPGGDAPREAAPDTLRDGDGDDGDIEDVTDDLFDLLDLGEVELIDEP